MGWWSYGNPNLFYSQASANSANKDIHVLQCHGDADPMVPFVFGIQTAEKMKSLINPSNVTFKPYRGLSHCACPEVSVGAGRGGAGGSPPVFLTHADWFLPVFFYFSLRRKWWISSGSSRSSSRPSGTSEGRGQGSPLTTIRLFLDFQLGSVGRERPRF